jgi:hypothetical protein
MLTPRPKSSKQPARNFFSSLRVSHSAAGQSAAMAQLGQDAIIAPPLNLNFTETISNGIRQCGQQSDCSSRGRISREETSLAVLRLTVFCVPAGLKGIASPPPPWFGPSGRLTRNQGGCQPDNKQWNRTPWHRARDGRTARCSTGRCFPTWPQRSLLAQRKVRQGSVGL